MTGSFIKTINHSSLQKRYPAAGNCKLPETYRLKLLHDERINLEIQKILNQGQPVFLSASGLATAYVASAESPSMRHFSNRTGFAERNGLFLSANTTYDVLMHEKVHLEDQVSGFSSRLANELEGTRKTIQLSQLGQVRIFQFITEQRAHVRQCNVLTTEGTVESAKGVEEIFDIFDRKYQVPLFNYVNSLDPTSRTRVIEFLKKWTLPESGLPSSFVIQL